MRDNFLEALKYNKDIEFAPGIYVMLNYIVQIGKKLDYYKATSLKNIEESKELPHLFVLFYY